MSNHLATHFQCKYDRKDQIKRPPRIFVRLLTVRIRVCVTVIVLLLQYQDDTIYQNTYDDETLKEPMIVRLATGWSSEFPLACYSSVLLSNRLCKAA